MNNYIIVNRDILEETLERLNNTGSNSHVEDQRMFREMRVLSNILSNSLPLLPELEKAFDAGAERGYELPSLQMRMIPTSEAKFPNKSEYFSQLKLDL